MDRKIRIKAQVWNERLGEYCDAWLYAVAEEGKPLVYSEYVFTDEVTDRLRTAWWNS